MHASAAATARIVDLGQGAARARDYRAMWGNRRFSFVSIPTGGPPMNPLIHWNPFKAMTRAEAAGTFDPLFRDFGMRPLFTQLDMPDIRIDVSETDKAYAIKADIPGAKKEDIDVAVDGRQVSITARSFRSTDKKDETSLYSERSEGQVFRSFTLPAEIDDKGAEATYTDGVLSLSLPKRAAGNNHRVKVS
jgi:HSP20 family protein